MADPEPGSWSRTSKKPKFTVNLLIFISLALFVGIIHWIQKSISFYISLIFIVPLLCFFVAWSEQFIDSCRTITRHENFTVPMRLRRIQVYLSTLVINPNTHLCSVENDKKRSTFGKVWPYEELNAKNLNEYFVGYLDLYGVKELLDKDGEFLIGVTGEKDLKAQLWVMWNNIVLNIPITKIQNEWNDSSQYAIAENRSFPDVGSLISWYANQNETLNVDVSGIKKQISLAKTDNWHPNRSWYISSSVLTVNGMLSAHKSIFRGNMLIKNKNQPVVIKCPREGNFQAVTDHLLQEGRLSRHLKHQNIVSYYGVAVDSYRIMLIMNCGAIDLHKCVKQCDLPLLLKLKFAQDIALGMRHISNERVLHNDLCLLNSVIFKDAKHGYIVRVVDFDLSIDMARNSEFTDLKVLPRVPAPYMSPEALIGLGSEKSDVWQYGLTLWELFTDGRVPYDNYKDESFMSLIVERGCTLKMANVPFVINELIKRCWNQKYFKRPSFDEICHEMSYLMCEIDNVCDRIEFKSKYPVIIYAFDTSEKLLSRTVEFVNNIIGKDSSIESKLSNLSKWLRMTTQTSWLCFAGDDFSVSYILFNSKIMYFKIASTKLLLVSS